MSGRPDAAGHPRSGDEHVVDTVVVRTLLLAGLPLLVASVGDAGRGPQLRAALEQRGVVSMPRFVGSELPRGAEVGFMLGTTGMRLVDDRDDDLLRAPREGLDEGWLSQARRLRGTMTVVVRGTPPIDELSPYELTGVIEACARAGDAWGAIVGFAEERPSLPLIF